MRHFKKSVAAAAFLASAFSATVQADVGVLDKYECHKHQQTKKYHCHGPADLAKLGGFVLGADARFTTWSTTRGNVPFIGVAVNSEYNHRWLAATASYYYQLKVTPNDKNTPDDVITLDQGSVLAGVQLGIKAGPGVGRLGSKYYATAGWDIAQITNSARSDLDRALGGYFVGAGFGFNTRALVFDVVGTYHDATKVNEYLTAFKPDDVTPDATVLSAKMSLGWRF